MSEFENWESDADGDPDSDVLDFVGRFLADESQGHVLPLGEYVARYPGNEEAIERAYLDLLIERRTPGGEGQFEGDVPEASSSDPNRVGPYRLVRRIGSGGQGMVYLAVDLRLRRQVALKLLHPTYVASTRARNRFRREAEVISRLNEPGLCTILDADLENETPYIAMRRVEGPTVAELVKSSRQGDATVPDWIRPTSRSGLEHALQLFENLARSLHAAHEASVVHRDIKPGNILWDRSDRLVLVDFGLAQDMAPEAETLTRASEVFGTPAYMSPEQVGGSRRVDRRTDVYSLAATIFEALTLERPFSGVGLVEQRRVVLDNVVPKIAGLNSVLPRDLNSLMDRALEGRIERRYATALELADELGRARRGDVLQARAISTSYRIAKFVSRHRTAVAGAVFGVLLTGVAIGAAVFGVRESAAADRTVASVERRSEQRRRAFEGLLALYDLRSGQSRSTSDFLSRVERDPRLTSLPWEQRFLHNVRAQPTRGLSISALTDSRVLRVPPAVSENGRYLVVRVSDPWGLVLVDRQVRTAQEYPASDEIQHLTMSSDGNYFGYFDTHKLHVVNCASGEKIMTPGRLERPHDITFVGSELYASMSRSSMIHVFSCETGEESSSFDATMAKTTFVPSEPGAVQVGLRGPNKWIRMNGVVKTSTWNTEGAELLETGRGAQVALRGRRHFVRDLEGRDVSSRTRDFDDSATSLGGALIANSDRTAKVELFDTFHYRRIGELVGLEQAVLNILFAEDDELLVLDSLGTVTSWDLSLGPTVPIARLNEFRGLAVSRTYLLSFDRFHDLKLWDPVLFEERRVEALPMAAPRGFALSKDGSKFLCAGLIERRGNGPGGLFRAGYAIGSTHDFGRSLLVGVTSELCRDQALSTDGEQAALLTEGEIRLVDTITGSEQLGPDLGGAKLLGIRARAGGGWYVASEDFIHSFSGSSVDPDWEQPWESPTDVLLVENQTGNRLAFTDGRGDLVIVDASDGSTVATINSLGTNVQAMAFHPTEPRIFVARKSNVLCYSLPTEESPHVLQVHDYQLDIGRVLGMTFTDDSSCLTVACQFGLTRLCASPEPFAVRRQRERRRRARSFLFRLMADGPSTPTKLAQAIDDDFPNFEVDRVLAHELVETYFSARALNIAVWKIVTQDAVDPKALEWCERAMGFVLAEIDSFESFWNTLAAVQLRSRQYEEALETLAFADSIDENDLSIRVLSHGIYPNNDYLRVEALLGLGRESEAKAALLRADTRVNETAYLNAPQRFSYFGPRAKRLMEEFESHKERDPTKRDQD